MSITYSFTAMQPLVEQTSFKNAVQNTQALKKILCEERRAFILKFTGESGG